MSISKAFREEDLLHLRDSIISLRESHLTRIKDENESVFKEMLSRLVH
jgi:hypothetical protein